MLSSEGKILFLILPAKAKAHVASRNGISLPQTQGDVHCLVLTLETQTFFSFWPLLPPALPESTRKTRKKAQFMKNSAFSSAPRKAGRPVCLDYSRAARGFCCGEKPKHIKQMYPHFWKRAWGTESDNFFNCSGLFNPPLRRDGRIHFLYHYPLCLFKSLRCQMERIEFPVKLGWV